MEILMTEDEKPTVFNVLQHGITGSGKTLAAGATAPRPLVILVETKGTDVLSRANIEKIYGAGRDDINYNVPFIKAHNHELLMEALAFVCSDSDDMKHFDTIVLDSFSEAVTLFLKHSKSRYTGWDVYTELFNDTIATLEALVDTPQHNIWTAHTSRVEDEDTKEVSYVPSLEGKKLTEEIPYKVGEIYYCDFEIGPDGSKNRVLRTAEGARGLAKSRIGVLDAIEPPHWGRIFKKLAGEKVEPLTAPTASKKKPLPGKKGK